MDITINGVTHNYGENRGSSGSKSLCRPWRACCSLRSFKLWQDDPSKNHSWIDPTATAIPRPTMTELLDWIYYNE